MKLIIFTPNKNSQLIYRFREEAKVRRLKIEIFNYKDISFLLNKNGVSFFSNNKKISFNGSIIRVGRPQLYNKRDIKIYDLLLNYFYENNIYFLNQKFLEKNPFISNKALQYLTLLKYTKKLILPTYYFESKEEFLKNIDKIIYPIIIKPIDGSQGTGIKKIDDVYELTETFKYLEVNEFILQAYIPNHGDVRTIYLGGKYLGSMLRTGKNGNIINNFSKGGDVEAYDLKLSIRKKINIIIKKLNMEYVGIDLIINQNNFSILEINQNPGFKGFESCTGINIAGKIIDFMIYSYNKKDHVKSS